MSPLMGIDRALPTHLVSFTPTVFVLSICNVSDVLKTELHSFNLI